MLNRKFLVDAAERILVTFVQAFLVGWLVFQDGQWDTFVDMDNVKAGLVGGALSAAKALLASQVGSDNTAALLPEGPDTDKG